MGREQKVRDWGEGWGGFPSLPLSPATNFFVTSVPVSSRDFRLPERKWKRLLRRLFVRQKDGFTSFLMLNVLEAKLFQCGFAEGHTVNM